MRAIVAGAGGMTGAELVRQAREKGWECEGFTKLDLDITDAGAVAAAVERARPEVVFNAAAWTAVDAAESARDEAMRVNAEGARNLARAATQTGASVVHISTDYVFDGKASVPYLPTDTVNPASVYGRTKLAGEIAVREECENHAIVRTSWVYSHEGRNFVRTMLGAAEDGRELRVVDDQHGSPTSAADLAGALIEAAAAIRHSSDLAGTYHFSNSGITTWYEFANAIFEIRGRPAPRIIPITTAQYPTAAHRPAWSALDTTSFERAFGMTPRPWRDALRDTMRRIR